MQRLRASEHRGQRLNRGAYHVVVGLLRGQRASRRLGMESQPPGARILRLVTLDHGLMPYAPGRAILGYFLEKIVVCVKEKRELRHELIDIQAAPRTPLDILQPVPQRERQFLDRRRTGFANVVAADRDGVELRRVLDAKFKS